MSLWIREKAKGHKVIHEFSGKSHYYKVYSGSKKEYSVSVKLSCECEYMGKQGIANGGMCSHILAVLQDISSKADLEVECHDILTISKRNACLNLLRIGSRRVNEVRYSTSEGSKHIEAKKQICKDLMADKKHFVTEAIFNTGGRADIFVLDDFKVIEIVGSEKEDSIERKKELYPEYLKFEVILV